MVNLKASKAVAVAIFSILFCSLISINAVNASTAATTLTLSISPSTVEHSSASQAAVTSVLDVTLTSASGTHLGNRGVTLYYRLVGSSSWTTVCSLSLDSSGQYYDATGFQY